MLTEMERIGSTLIHLVLILLTYLKFGSLDNTTEFVKNPEPIKFTHKMYPVMINSDNQQLTLKINSVADCYWTQKGYSMTPRRVKELPYRTKLTQWNRSINAFKLLEQSVRKHDTFTCHCNISMAGRIILVAVEFLAFRSKNLPKLQTYYKRTRENKRRRLYPLLESCMSTTAVYNNFYRFYLKRPLKNPSIKEQDAPQPCFQSQRPIWQNFLILRVPYDPLKKLEKNVRCDFKGFPRPRVEFLYNGVVQGGPRSPLRNGTNKIILPFNYVKQSALISCKASNKYGTNYITILWFPVDETIILFKPEFKHQTRTTHFYLSNETKEKVLTCPLTREARAHFDFLIWVREMKNTTTNLIEYVASGINSWKVEDFLEFQKWKYFCVTCETNECTITQFIMSGFQDSNDFRINDRSRISKNGDDENRESVENESESESELEDLDDGSMDAWQLGFWVAVGSVIVVSFLLSTMLLIRFLYSGRTPVTYQVRMTNVRKTSADSMRNYSTPLVQSRRESHYFLAPLTAKEMFPSPGEDYVAMSVDLETSTPSEKRFRFSRESLQIIKPLGEGAFGRVKLARIVDGPMMNKLIAMKELKDSCCDYLNVSSLTHEIQVLKTVGPHPHIIRLLGSSTKARNPFMVMEFCSNGSLKSYLQLLRVTNGVGEQHLQGFVRQIARGMEFLSSKQFLHCDLAARNVFLTDTFICKIADFGMARRIDQEPNMQANVALPIRWLAPEVILEKKFSLTSDVWSFGVLVWEIYSLGAMPYQGYDTQDVCSILTSGYRMTKPDLCPLPIWMIVEEAWSATISDRPSFYNIVQRLSVGRRRSSTISYRRGGSVIDSA